MGPQARVQWVGPLPPRRTGIAGYCDDFLRAVDGLWDVDLFLESGSRLPKLSTIRDAGERCPDPALPTVIHLGNSEHHERAFQTALDLEGVIVLHDVVLHHAMLVRHLRTRSEADYWAELRRRYGSDGVAVGEQIVAGRPVEDLQDYPLSERYIERARMVIVHSEHARQQVMRHVPGAKVVRVPMGVPLPAEIGRDEARYALDIPESQFVVASITHVNPNKRIPVVLRAIRRLATRLPETRFIIAGSQSDSEDMRREVRLLGLEGIVSCLGYVDAVTARLLAAASDACVNLRYPSTGETSASLLRLLASGRPVLITDDGSGSEVPSSVAVKIKPDEFEVEIIEAALFELAGNESLRNEVGQAARAWVSREHSMGAAVDGYRHALQAAYDVELPGLPDPVVPEHLPRAKRGRLQRRRPGTIAGEVVGEALSELGVGPDLPIVRDAAEAIHELGIERIRSRQSAGDAPCPTDRLIEKLACPHCGGGLRPADDELACHACGKRLRLVDGVPDFRASQGAD